MVANVIMNLKTIIIGHELIISDFGNPQLSMHVKDVMPNREYLIKNLSSFLQTNSYLN